MTNVATPSSYLRVNKTLVTGIMLFSSGILITIAFTSYLSYINSTQIETAPFPPNAEVADSCSIKDFGYLSLNLAFYEQGTNFKVDIPTRVLIQGPDNKMPLPQDYVGEINSFYGSKPPGTYTVTITSLEDQNNRMAQNSATISYNLECMTKNRYDLGQNVGGLLALANVMYLVGFPIMIYGIIKERKIRKRKAIASGYWKAQVQRHGQSRPPGIKLLAIESIVGAAFLFFGSFFLAALSAAMNESLTLREKFIPIREAMPFPLNNLDFSAIAIICLLLGIVSLVEGYGLLNRKKWAWTMALITNLISIGLSIFFMVSNPRPIDSESIGNLAFGLGISGLVVYYLRRPSVRKYFGREEKSQF